MNSTGQYYYNARWYDLNLGRFTTEDPISDGLNWYAYANNNPLRFVDPTGLIDVESDIVETETYVDVDTDSLMTGDPMDIFDDPEVAKADTLAQLEDVVDETVEMISFTTTLGGLLPDEEVSTTLFFIGVGTDLYSTLVSEDMSGLELGIKIGLGVVGLISSPAVAVPCVLATMYVGSAFDHLDDGPITTTDNMSDLSDFLGGTIDWAMDNQ